MDTSTEKITDGPLVSITMATYNRAEYIEQAISSVLRQTYQNWELIVVDDGSSDDTRERVTVFADSRIRYMRHDSNKGIYQTRTDAVAAAHGMYIAVLDSDDVWAASNKLAKQIVFLESHPDHAIVGTYIKTIDAHGNEIGRDTYFQDDADIRAHILKRNQFAHSSVLMRKSIVEKVSGYRDIGLAEDLDLILHMGLYGKFATIPEYMTLYRVHAGGITKNALPMARAVQLIIKEYRSQYPNYVPALVKSYLRLLLARLR